MEAHVEAVRWKHFSGFLRSNPPLLCSGVLHLPLHVAVRGSAWRCQWPGCPVPIDRHDAGYSLGVALDAALYALEHAPLFPSGCSRPGVPVRLGAQGDVWRIRGLGARVSAEFADVCVDVVGGPSAREDLPGLAGSSLLYHGCRGVRA